MQLIDTKASIPQVKKIYNTGKNIIGKNITG